MQEWVPCQILGRGGRDRDRDRDRGKWQAEEEATAIHKEVACRRQFLEGLAAAAAAAAAAGKEPNLTLVETTITEARAHRHQEPLEAPCRQPLECQF